MPPEIVALIDKPWLLAIVIAIGAVSGIAVERVAENMRRSKWRAYWQGRNSKRAQARGFRRPFKAAPPTRSNERASLDAAEQLRLVMRADFKRRPLLNRKEADLFKVLDKLVIDRNPKWQVMAQVAIGEFIGSSDREAYGCINSKRVDFLLVDGDCQARHALEYQGDGHHQSTAAARDAVKKEALRKAGVGYHEVVAGHTTRAELKRLVEKLVPPPESDRPT